jgi:Fe-S-cluster containining protein
LKKKKNDKSNINKKDITLPFGKQESKFEKIYGKNQTKRPKDRFRIIKMINGLTNKSISETNLKINIPEKVHFSCNNCGNCCKKAKYRIPVSITDLAFWINSNKKNFLRTLEYNRGHPKFTFFLINKLVFKNEMIENHGKFFYDYFLDLNPSLIEIEEENYDDCVYYNSINGKCSIYTLRPIHCSVYPYNLILGIDIESLFAKAYKKLSGMSIKDKDYKTYMRRIKNEEIMCPNEVIEEIPANLKNLHRQKLTKRIKKFIIGGLFSGSLYFKNRRDISEEIFASLFAKVWE